MGFCEWLIDHRKDKSRSDSDWYPNQVEILEAGAASRQGEVDIYENELKIKDGMLKQKQDEIDELQRFLSDSLSLEESESIKFKMQANELQKRIDEAMTVLDKKFRDITYNDALMALDILKGKKDE